MKFATSILSIIVLAQVSASADAACTGLGCVNTRRSLQMDTDDSVGDDDEESVVPSTTFVPSDMGSSSMPSTIMSDSPSGEPAPVIDAPAGSPVSSPASGPVSSPARTPARVPTLPPTSGSSSSIVSFVVSVAAAVTPLFL